MCNRNIYYHIFLFQFFQATVQTGCGDINSYFCSLRGRCKLATEIAIVGRPPDTSSPLSLNRYVCDRRVHNLVYPCLHSENKLTT